jgi:hypothetical protein
VRVGAGPKPSKRSLRKAAKRVVDAVRAVREHRLRDADPASLEAADKVADELFGKEPVITFGPERDEAVTNPVVEAIARENAEDLRQTLRRATAEETRREMNEAPND